MKIELIGDLIDQPDGSALAQLDVDEEGKMYLMQLGFERLIMRGLTLAKREKENGANESIREVGEDPGHELPKG